MLPFRAARQLRVEIILERGSVGQSGQNVVAREIFHLFLHHTPFRQVAQCNDLGGTTTIFNGMNSDLKDARGVAHERRRFQRTFSSCIYAMSVRRSQQIVWAHSDEITTIFFKKTRKPPVDLNDHAIAHDGKAVKCRVGEAFEVNEVAVDDHCDGRRSEDQKVTIVTALVSQITSDVPVTTGARDGSGVMIVADIDVKWRTQMPSTAPIAAVKIRIRP